MPLNDMTYLQPVKSNMVNLYILKINSVFTNLDSIKCIVM